VKHTHDRKHVILDCSQFAPWLDHTHPLEDVAKLLTPFPVERLDVIEVCHAVNSPKNNRPKCWQPAAVDRQSTLFDDFAV
jgi:putative SOS response-associated peptidase YedK